MIISPERLKRLRECLGVLDQAAAIARVDRQSHNTALTALQEFDALLVELSAPKIEPSSIEFADPPPVPVEQ